MINTQKKYTDGLIFEDTIIGLPLSILAKENGFLTNEITPWIPRCECYNTTTGKLINPNMYCSKNPHALAPTQSVLRNWFSNKHDIHVLVSIARDSFELEPVIIYKDEDGDYGAYYIPQTYKINEYHIAFENGLTEAFKFIKK